MVGDAVWWQTSDLESGWVARWKGSLRRKRSPETSPFELATSDSIRKCDGLLNRT